MGKFVDKFVWFIDSLNTRISYVIKWFSIVLVLIGVYEVTARFVFNRPTEWGYEMLLMLGATMYILSWSYLHKNDDHVKIDVVFNLLSERTRKIINIVCAVFIHVPLMSVFSYVAFKKMVRAWRIGEISIETTWNPPLAPLKTIIFIGVLLYLLQVISRLIQEFRSLKNTCRSEV